MKFFSNKTFSQTYLLTSKKLEKLRLDKKLYDKLKMNGNKSDLSTEFQRALDLMYKYEDELEEYESDEDLPSFLTILSKSPKRSQDELSDSSFRSESSQISANTRERRSKKRTQNFQINIGDHVLAYWIDSHSYFPARVLDIRRKVESNQYRIEYSDGSKKWLGLSSLISQQDPYFFRARLADNAYDCNTVLTTYYDPVLEIQVMKLEDKIIKIYSGEFKSERYEDYIAGGKRKKSLPERSGRGPFDASQHFFIAKCIQKIINEKTDCVYNDEFKDIDIITAVVLPETIKLLIMEREGCNGVDAENKLMEEHWAVKLLSLRESFREGGLNKKD